MGLLQKACFAAAVSSLALVASAADAATLITSIKITSSIPSYLQVAELQAFSNGVNVAAAANGASATSSSVYDPSAGPGNAIDGSLNGNYPAIFHSAGAGSNEYLLVTLAGSGFALDTLKIYGRTDCCSDRDGFNYTLFSGSQVVGQGTLDARNGPATASVSIAAVPESATWAMMLAGFGLIGAGVRSGRKQSVRVTYA